MTESEWKELRKILKEAVVMSVGTSYRVNPLINSLEAEFDRLQEDAEKSWKDSCNSIDIITRKLGEERNKLEEIKEIVESWREWGITGNEALNDIRKLLEVEK